MQTGVWSGDSKVCAIGVRLIRARVTLHGFAVNCDTEMSWFEGIVACGLTDRGVTSLSQLAGRDVSVTEMRPLVEAHLADVFGLDLSAAPPEMSGGFEPANGQYSALVSLRRNSMTSGSASPVTAKTSTIA